MKTLYTFTICLLVGSMAFGQTGSGSKKKSKPVKVHIIEYDNRQQSSEKVLYDKFIRQGEIVRLRIENINRLTHKVEFKTETKDYVTEPSPGIAAALGIKENNQESESKDNKSLDKTGGAIGAMKVTQANTSSTPIQPQMDALVTNCESLLELSNKLADIKKKRQELINLVGADVSSYQDLLGKLRSIYASRPDIGTITKDISDYLQSYEAAKLAYDRAESAAKSQELTVLALARLSFVKDNDISAYEEAVKRNQLMAEAREEIQKAKTDIKEAYETLEGEDVYAFAQDILTLYDQLLNDENFISTSDPAIMKGDYLIFTVKITPRDTDNKEVRSFNIQVPGKGGWKTDFSLGPAFSFGKGAKDDLYFLETAQDSSILRLKSNNNILRSSIASMMHLYWRSASNTKLGFAFGVGANFESPDDPDLSYYSGLSAIFGKAQKVTVSAGVSFLRTERFTGEYEVGKKYLTDVISAATKTEKAIRASAFLSISYSLAKK